MTVSPSSSLHESHLSHEDNSNHKLDVEKDGKVNQLSWHSLPERWYSALHSWNQPERNSAKVHKKYSKLVLWSLLNTNKNTLDLGSFVYFSRAYLCDAQDSLLVEHQTRDWKAVWVRVSAWAVREFSSPELAFRADSYSLSIPPCVTAVAHKRPWPFC